MSRRAWAEAARKLFLTTLSSSSSSSLASRVIVRTSKTGSPLLSIPTGSASPADTPHNYTQYYTNCRNVCVETVTRCSRASILSKQQISMYIIGCCQDIELATSRMGMLKIQHVALCALHASTFVTVCMQARCMHICRLLGRATKTCHGREGGLHSLPSAIGRATESGPEGSHLQLLHRCQLLLSLDLSQEIALVITAPFPAFTCSILLPRVR